MKLKIGQQVKIKPFACLRAINVTVIKRSKPGRAYEYEGLAQTMIHHFTHERVVK